MPLRSSCSLHVRIDELRYMFQVGDYIIWTCLHLIDEIMCSLIATIRESEHLLVYSILSTKVKITL